MEQCDICGKQMKYGLSVHKERMHGTEEQRNKYSSGNHGKYDDPAYIENLKNARENSNLRKFGIKKQFSVCCFKCKLHFDVIEYEKKFPIKEKYFCSRACSNSHIRTDESKQKTSNSLKGRFTKPLIEKECQRCFCKYFSKTRSKFCSKDCSYSFKRSKQETDLFNLKDYRRACNFKFALNAFPNEFDFSLIEEHGWYSPSNSRNPNLSGISRDHMLSVRFGFDNQLDPKILSHPANCQLLPHGDNISKGKKCKISLDELMNKIDSWNKMYNN